MFDTIPSCDRVYWRVQPGMIKGDVLSADAFRPGSAATAGLSVYDAEMVTAQHVLQLRINQLEADGFHEKVAITPNVISMLAKGWRIIEIPVSVLNEMGFELSQPETSGRNRGHRNVLGEAEKFKSMRHEFNKRYLSGEVRIMSAAECLV